MALLVIEGLDGAGKSTQVNFLKDYIKSLGKDYQYLHFPQTESPVYGELIARFLKGELGNNNEVNPYLVALIYAGDRADARPLLQKWMDESKTIILDRYVYSNVAYQCAKLNKQADRDKLKTWILETEFNYFKLPKPDLNIFLDVPFTFTKEKLTGQRTGSDRAYLGGERDIHEEDLEFQSRVREVYLTLTESNFVRVNCCLDEKTMLAPEVIFNLIRTEIEKRSK